jgi:hypothetical protein
MFKRRAGNPEIARTESRLHDEPDEGGRGNPNQHSTINFSLVVTASRTPDFQPLNTFPYTVRNFGK